MAYAGYTALEVAAIEHIPRGHGQDADPRRAAEAAPGYLGELAEEAGTVS